MNNNSVQPFEFDGAEVRTILIDDEPWFVASDIAKILGYRDASNMARRLDDDDKGTRSVSTPSGEQQMTVITEPGLYVAVLGSRVEGAKKFKRWVTREVLPAIRKTGSYGVAKPAELTRSDLARMVLEAENEKLALSSKLEAIQPKADYVDTFVADEDLITFRTLASDLGVGERDLRDALIYCGWIYSQTKSRWSNTKEKLVPVTRYSAMADKKHYFQAVLNHDVPRFGGEVMHTLKVTAPGAGAVTKLVNRLATQYGSFADSIIPLETRYNERKAS
ncbi:phage antirepressor [Glutamicibacter protophormiae]|uniref:phage antirepressor n=1 Tax=Glutamicibacter protophormiae TaxID=37930 RepID=UPI00195D118A|nr:phage antirepressor [Glutamicibacter protophormiae]QRQ79140.1 phage antirepressor [Glutamicibacter protophormiae]